ncbi:GIY-YIG nuclease family protein [Methanohalophilus sp.]|uniref:GIY-YIG nuclease family protein n=1 Tax=Methanohalophilus sp. TaxID=1966352 RepID=UPI002605F481|nr:GIY-YIG nuclease family protein [Methanohalophilus sp.]MDK2891787.1 hypothetical protein [Methanohalophilus sp.]
MVDSFPKGTYCIILKTGGCTQKVGSLGEIEFKTGYYVYVGSALGPGGLKRMYRHISLYENRGEDYFKKPRWHIDYLLLSPFFNLEDVLYVESEERIECALAERIDVGILGFGCSDCSCHSHLFYRQGYPVEEIKKVIEGLNQIPQILGKGIK